MICIRVLVLEYGTDMYQNSDDDDDDDDADTYNINVLLQVYNTYNLIYFIHTLAIVFLSLIDN